MNKKDIKHECNGTYPPVLKFHFACLLMQKENGKRDAAKHGAEFPNIGSHSPEQQVNQKWPYRNASHGGNLSIVVSDGVDMAGMAANAHLYALIFRRLSSFESFIITFFDEFPQRSLPWF
jgi:hypothetical protein